MNSTTTHLQISTEQQQDFHTHHTEQQQDIHSQHPLITQIKTHIGYWIIIPIIILLILSIWLYVQSEAGCTNMPKTNLIKDYPDLPIQQAEHIFNQALKEKRQAITSLYTNQYGYQYVKNTNFTIYRFPQSQRPIKQQPQPLLTYQVLQSQQQRQLFLRNLSSCHGHISLHDHKRRRARLGWAFYNNPDSPAYNQAEYYHFDKQYNISKYKQELGICVISLGKNMHSREVYKQFFLTLNQQNYSNFRVVLTDDASNDSSVRGMYSFIAKYTPRLRPRVVLIGNQENTGTFENKDSGLKEICRPDDIIVDIDGDDALVGKQVFNLVNAIYQGNPNLWVVYTSYFGYKNQTLITKTIDAPIYGRTDQYRFNHNRWSTSHLKTYRMAAYGKIPFSHLGYISKDINGKKTYKYQPHASDMTLMIDLIELSGQQRIMYLPQALYAYRLNVQVETNSFCHRVEQLYNQWMTRMKTPLQPLPNLQAQVKLMENPQHPYRLKTRYNRLKHIFQTQCN